METYNTLLKIGELEATKYSKEKTAIKSLLLFASKLSPTELYLNIDNEVTDESIINTYNKAVEDYTINNIPVQYIIGYAYFYGYKILVDNRCLIPRWETEELANNILIYYDRMFKGKKIKTLDLGTGSGAIAIALSKEEPNMEVYASDLSSGAIDIAKESAKLNNATVDFRVGSWFEPFKDSNLKFDIIVSNPPYLTTTEYVESIVKDNEPDMALYGGLTGLTFYNDILKDIKNYLNLDKFVIGFEHGYQQTKDLNNLIRKYFEHEKIINLKDQSGKDRMTIIIKE